MRKTKQAETVDEKMKDNEGEEKIKEKRKMVQKGSTNSITSLHRDAADGAVRLRGSRQANIRPTMHFFFSYSSLDLLVQSQGRSKNISQLT